MTQAKSASITPTTIYLQNLGIGDATWLQKHLLLCEISDMFGEAMDVTIFQAGQPCGGYFYEVDVFRDIEDITRFLGDNGFHFSTLAQKMIMEGEVKEQR